MKTCLRITPSGPHRGTLGLWDNDGIITPLGSSISVVLRQRFKCNCCDKFCYQLEITRSLVHHNEPFNQDKLTLMVVDPNTFSGGTAYKFLTDFGQSYSLGVYQSSNGLYLTVNSLIWDNGPLSVRNIAI
jgi:hypothetical protein